MFSKKTTRSQLPFKKVNRDANNFPPKKDKVFKARKPMPLTYKSADPC